MSIDLLESIERDQNAMERIAGALEVIADSLAAWYKLEAERMEKEFPSKPEPRDAIVTHIPTADDLLRESQGASEEPIEEWIGLREREFIGAEPPKTTNPKK